MAEISPSTIDTLAIKDCDRKRFYEKAIAFRKNNEYEDALICFLSCIKDLKINDHFTELPNCLQYISEIYSVYGDLGKAVKFMQAVKLYYEIALIKNSPQEQRTNSENAANEADEYEKLSKLCLQQKQVGLALEYCGKATQLKSRVYGEESQQAKECFNMMTHIYAEMGKEQYTSALSTLKSVGNVDQNKHSNDAEDSEIFETSEKEKTIENLSIFEKDLRIAEPGFLADDNFSVKILIIIPIFIVIIGIATCYFLRGHDYRLYYYIPNKVREIIT